MEYKFGDRVMYGNEEYIVNGVDISSPLPYRLVKKDGSQLWVLDHENIKYIKPTINDLRDYMLEHFIDEDGSLDISGLDFSEISGNVDISYMVVNGNLYQELQTVNGDLKQSFQYVRGDLCQSNQTVKRDYYCDGIECCGELYYSEPQKLLKEITKEELAEMGYKLKGGK